MSSLELFAKKYAATYDFSEENGLVSVNIYWNDKLTDLGENYKRGGGINLFSWVKFLSANYLWAKYCMKARLTAFFLRWEMGIEVPSISVKSFSSIDLT